MNGLAMKWAGIGLAAVLLLVLGDAGGVWLAVRHYRPLLDTAETSLATEKSVSANLLALTTEQGLALGKLVEAGKQREEKATAAVNAAKEEAKPDYAAANRLQQERTGGDPATAAMSIIDQELGL